MKLAADTGGEVGKAFAEGDAGGIGDADHADEIGGDCCSVDSGGFAELLDELLARRGDLGGDAADYGVGEGHEGGTGGNTVRELGVARECLEVGVAALVPPARPEQVGVRARSIEATTLGGDTGSDEFGLRAEEGSLSGGRVADQVRRKVLGGAELL